MLFLPQQTSLPSSWECQREVHILEFLGYSSAGGPSSRTPPCPISSPKEHAFPHPSGTTCPYKLLPHTSFKLNCCFLATLWAQVSSCSISRKETCTGPGTGFRTIGQRMQGPNGCNVVLGRHHSCPWALPASHLLQQSAASGHAQGLLEQRIQEKDSSCPKGGNALFVSFNFGQK